MTVSVADAAPFARAQVQIKRADKDSAGRSPDLC
jgi:hypothetical protein